MCKISIQEYVLDKSKHVIDAYNAANAYKRDLLEMIQRTLGPLNKIEEKLIMLPLHIDYPKSSHDIFYDIDAESYRIGATCLMENKSVSKVMHVTLIIPYDVFNINDAEEIESYYNELYRQDIIELLDELEKQFAEQLKRVKPLKDMMVDGKNISQIGGVLNVEE